jgi:hypothetical protein
MRANIKKKGKTQESRRRGKLKNQEEGVNSRIKEKNVAENRLSRLFTKNTAFSQHESGSIRSDPCPMVAIETN